MSLGIIPYRGSVEILRPLIEQWFEMARNRTMGVDISVEATMRDLSQQELMQMFLLTDGEKVRGFIAIDIWPSPIGDDVVANERYWYVDPEFRGTNSLRLLNAAKQWATNCGASVFLATASNLGSDSHDKLCMLYEDLGMSQYQTIYSVRL